MAKCYIFETNNSDLTTTKIHGVYLNRDSAVEAAWNHYTKSIDDIDFFESDIIEFCELKRQEYLATSDEDVNLLIEKDIKHLIRDLTNHYEEFGTFCYQHEISNDKGTFRFGCEEGFYEGRVLDFFDYLKNIFKSEERGVISDSGYFKIFNNTYMTIVEVEFFGELIKSYID